MSNSIANRSTPWTRWKENSADACWLALLLAGLGAAGLAMFMFLFFQEPHRLLLISGSFFVGLWVFFVGVSALNAYLMSHPKFSQSITTHQELSDIE